MKRLTVWSDGLESLPNRYSAL